MCRENFIFVKILGEIFLVRKKNRRWADFHEKRASSYDVQQIKEIACC